MGISGACNLLQVRATFVGNSTGRQRRNPSGQNSGLNKTFHHARAQMFGLAEEQQRQNDRCNRRCRNIGACFDEAFKGLFLSFDVHCAVFMFSHF